ncbi:MAG: elongation factor 1-beta [Thermoplasmata archaeon]
MGDVAVRYRLLPESPEQDIDALMETLKKSLPPEVKFRASEIKPFAFGLKSIEILVVFKDAGGLSEQTENALQQVPGIQSVEVLEMGLL